MAEANRAEGEAATGALPGDNDVVDLIAQLRDLAGADPAGVQQVVTEVLTALDRASGGALRDQLPDALHPPAAPEARSGTPEARSGTPEARSGTPDPAGATEGGHARPAG